MAEEGESKEAMELAALRGEVAAMRELLLTMAAEFKSTSGPEKLNGVAVKTSDLMNGFQGALARAIKARRAADTDDSEDIADFVVQDLEVEFAAPIVAERSGDEPVLLVPNIKSVNTESPLARLKFTVGSVPPRE